MALLDYAWTERYVVPGGAGSQTGMDWANAFSETGMLADAREGRRYNLAGSFTPSATLLSGRSGTAFNPIAFRGWKADKSAPADSLDDLADISGAGHTGFVLEAGSYNIFQGLDIHSGAGMGVYCGTKAYCFFDLCKVRNNAGYGLQLWSNSQVSRSKIYGNGDAGLFAGDYGYGDCVSIDSCEVYNNGTTYNCYIDERNGVSITKSYFSGASYGLCIVEPKNVSIEFCTIDGAATGLYMAASTSSSVMLIGNQFTNNSTTALDISRANIVLHNNFYGNTADMTGSALVFEKSGNTFLNPQYVDIANDNYQIQNSSLIGVNIPSVLGSMNIGAWQGSSSGSSGGLKVHPGMNGGVNG